MHSKPQRAALQTLQRPLSLPRAVCAVTLSLSLTCLALTGCAGTIAKHTDALALATAPVVDEAQAAYSDAEKLHDVRVDFDAVTAFDKTSPVYDPELIQPLLSDKDIQARLTLLEAFQCYVRTLVDITHNLDSPALQAASVSVGNSLTGIGNTFAPVFASAFSLPIPAASSTSTTTTTTTGATSTSTTAAAIQSGPITPAAQNAISTAVDALGRFLVSKKIKSELPAIVKDMDPRVEALCELLIKDLAIIQDQEKRDYDTLIDRQTLFIRTYSSSTNPLNPQQRRDQIMKLPQIVRQQRRTTAQLAELRTAIVKLELTHHALAADAQGNNPESLSQKIGDLSAAGSNLGKFYSSLPTTSQ